MRMQRHPQRRTPITPSAVQAMLKARAELYSDAPGLQGDDALAERERLRLEAEAKARRQGVLLLRPG